MHQPAPGVLFKEVALENDPVKKRSDQPQEIAAASRSAQAFEGPPDPGSDRKLIGIGADLYRKPSGDAVKGPQDEKGQRQVKRYRI